MARILVCGTLAYDLIGHFDAPLAADTRNVKLDRIDEGFGGCAMNIAYNLALLGHEPVPLVYVGDDYEPEYGAHVRRSGISEMGIVRVPDARCARGIVLTGNDGAQFTAFHPGPAGTDRTTHDIGRLTAGMAFDAAVLAPDLPARTLACARHLATIPLRVWCPGQYADHTSTEDLLELLGSVDLVIANRREWQAMRARLPGGVAAAVAGRDPRRHPVRLVVTDGAEPVEVLPEQLRWPVPIVAKAERVDPTGCGDAFAAALAGGLAAGQPLDDAIRVGIGLAGRCLRRRGAQNH